MQPQRGSVLELEAAWTLAALRSGRPVRRDMPGAAPGTHDFDVQLPEGRMIALEVTSSTVPEVVAMWDAIGQLDWAVPSLTRSWSVSLQAAERGKAGTRVRRFHKEAPSLLRVLESELPTRAGDLFGTPLEESLSSRALQTIQALRALGVRHGGPVDTMTGNPPLLLVGTVGQARWLDGSSVNQAVADALSANAKKLEAPKADERHLWLWVDSTDSEGAASMHGYSLPAETPDLDDRADEVWVALWLGRINYETNIGALWHVVAGGEWQRIPVPAVRTYAASKAEAPPDLE